MNLDDIPTFAKFYVEILEEQTGEWCTLAIIAPQFKNVVVEHKFLFFRWESQDAVLVSKKRDLLDKALNIAKNTNFRCRIRAYDYSVLGDSYFEEVIWENKVPTNWKP